MHANHSFVLGDLNYRCNLPSSSRGVENSKSETKAISQKMVQLADWKAFNELDELTVALKDKKVLVGFQTRKSSPRVEARRGVPRCCRTQSCLAMRTGAPPSRHPIPAHRLSPRPASPKFPPTFKLERRSGCHYNL